MKLELRASGGPTCTKCGSHELLHTAGTHEQFVTDLTDLLADRNHTLEADALAVVNAKCDQLKANVAVQVDRLHTEVAAVYRNELHALTGALDTYLAEDISRLRFLRRRYRDKLRDELQEQADKLLARTHLI